MLLSFRSRTWEKPANRRADVKSSNARNKIKGLRRAEESAITFLQTKTLVMRFNFRVISILVLNILFVPTLIYKGTEENTPTVSDIIPNIERSENHYISKYRFEKGYEEAVQFIKDHEGFNKGYKYTDVAGVETIGYGHVILPGEEFPDRISQEQAEEILRKDFDKAVRAAERETDLSGYKKIAVAHFIYAKGIGNFIRSNLKKKIDAGEDVEDEFKKWCYYRSSKTGKLVRSEYSYKIRLWEIDMFKRAEKLKYQ